MGDTSRSLWGFQAPKRQIISPSKIRICFKINPMKNIKFSRIVMFVAVTTFLQFPTFGEEQKPGSNPSEVELSKPTLQHSVGGQGIQEQSPFVKQKENQNEATAPAPLNETQKKELFDNILNCYNHIEKVFPGFQSANSRTPKTDLTFVAPESFVQHPDSEGSSPKVTYFAQLIKLSNVSGSEVLVVRDYDKFPRSAETQTRRPSINRGRSGRSLPDHPLSKQAEALFNSIRHKPDQYASSPQREIPIDSAEAEKYLNYSSQYLSRVVPSLQHERNAGGLGNFCRQWILKK